jgi:nucleotide-binding universal stress UspA family protein
VTLPSILCAVDFSEQSRHALRWAGEIAAGRQSRVIVLSVVDPLLAEAAKARLGQDLSQTETEPALREFVAATWRDGDPPPRMTLTTRVGEAAPTILDTAARERVALIVIGTQGLSGIRKWLLGSVTERVLRRAMVPVLAVPPAIQGSEPSASAGPSGISRMVVATDFSDSSAAAIAWAAQIAQPSTALILVHAVEPVAVPEQWRSVVGESDASRIADAHGRLGQVAAQLEGAGHVETVASVGRPDDVIGSIAADRGAQLIVMGLGNEQGLLATRPGSIAYRVLSSSTVPVLVVPRSATSMM